MMLLLDEEACKKLPEEKQVLYLLQWLQNLPLAIRKATKEELKTSQKQLVTQLQSRLHVSLGPPLHFCLGRAFVALYAVGDTFSLHDTLGKCCDVIKAKEDVAAGPSNNKLAAIECLGAVYEHHGCMAGSMFPDTVQILVKTMRTQEYRSEILNCFCRLLHGLGPSATSAHKDVYKCVRNGLTDKSMATRSAAAKCALELSQHSNFLYSQDFDAITNSCLRALDGSSYIVRCSVSKLFGTLLSLTQKPLPKTLRGKLKLLSLEEALTVLSNGFVRGASGFLKTGGSELLKMGSASREVRVGITQTYVVFLMEMGGVWVERNLATIARHVLELVAHPKTTQSHIDAVYTRKCVEFIFRSVFGKLLGELAQLVAAKHLCQLITTMLTTPTSSSSSAPHDDGGEQPLEGASGGVAGGGGGGGGDRRGVNQHHAIICSMLEIGALVYSLNTAALPLVTRDNSGLIPTETEGRLPPLLSALHLVLLHSSSAVRLAGAWCVHCLGLSLPSQLSSLLDYCMVRLHQARPSPTAISGYVFAIASLLGTVRYSELGLPTAKALEVYRTAQSLVALAKEESLENIQSGWALIGAYISLGPTHVSTQLRSLLSLWRSSFPRSMKELGDEQTGGTLDFWTSAFETRTGALASICSFLVSCGEMVTPDISSRLMLPLDSALAMLSKLPLLVKLHGVQIKACGAMLRLRLYQTFSHLPPTTYEGSLNVLLRELVTEISLADNLANTTTTSLLRSMCHHDDSILLGAWLEETDQRSVEEQLQPNSAAGSGALEHDPLCVFMNRNRGMTTPGPLPLGVAVIDSAVLLFGRTFPAVANKHRLQLLTHFRECVRQAKGARQQAIQVNIFTAFLAALKKLVENKSVLGEQDLFQSAYALIASALASSEPMLRCAAGEALGRMSQVGGDADFMSQIAQGSFDMLKSTRDAIPRMGHALVLGCLHRYVGGMGSGQHLQTSVRFLHSLARDTASHLVQVWSLHALALIADSGGPMFRNYVEMTLSLILSLLVTTPPSLTEIHQCLGKCLSALLTTLGPELQDTSPSMTTTRSTCLTCCSIIQNHPDAIVQSAAIACSQQLQVFAPQYVSLPDIVPLLCRNLDSSHLLLRRAAANCLRQFTQRDPETVWNLAKLVWRGADSSENGTGTEERGLEHVVLAKLDTEHDRKLCADLREILFSILTSLAPENPMKWLQLCNGVLAAVNEKSSQGHRLEEGETAAHQGEGAGEVMDEDMAKFTTGEEQQPATKISPRWPTREFAIECSRKIYNVCESDPAHFDLSLAQQQKRLKGGDYLVMHLSDLVRISFIAATASVDQLKLAGYQALRDVIELFSSTPDPDCPGHSLLEQYQAQIGAALRPAFAADTAPHVTAMACQVCSDWLAESVSGNHGDLKRVQQLLVSSLQKITAERQHTSLYGEAVATMESLAVLNAWAELYIKVSEDLVQQQQQQQQGGLGGSEDTSTAMALLDPHLPLLTHYWLAALQDHAHLSLPSHFSRQLPPNGGTFYSNNVAKSVKPYFDHNWPSLLHAAAIWLQTAGLAEDATKQEEALPATQPPLMPEPLLSTPGVRASTPSPLGDRKRDRFHLVLGLAVQTLCTPATLDSRNTLLHCVKTLNRLLQSNYVQTEINVDPRLATEILHLLHRLLLTCQSHDLHVIVMQIAVLVGRALQGEGAGKKGERDNPGREGVGLEECEKTPMFALLEVSACCLLRLVPDLTPRESPSTFLPHSSSDRVSSEEMTVASHAVSLLPVVISLCSLTEAEKALPTVLHILLSTVKFASFSQPLSSGLLSSSVRTLQQLVSQLPLAHPTHSGTLSLTLRSALSSLLLGKGGGGGGGGGFGTTGGDGGGDLSQMDKEVKLLVLTVFLRSPSPSVCPPNSQLSVAAAQLFRECLFMPSEKVQLKALQMVRSVFQITDEVVRNPFLHALGPEMVKLVESKAEPVAVVIESLQVLEMLLEMTPETHKPDMLGLLLPLLISCLSTTTPSPTHGYALQRLVDIGPKYPAPFKNIMQSAPLLRQKLENAIKANQGGNPTTAVPGGRREASKAPAQPPSIKLKMDFSNFK